MKLSCLDLYCGGGGAGQGYFLAGYDVTGVDIDQQPKYPRQLQFIQTDALGVLRDINYCRQFDLIHASPVCKRYSTITKTAGTSEDHPDDIAEVRELLQEISKPYVIENVPGAPLRNYVELCGTMFGLNVIRHRWFECWPEVWFPPFTCNHQKTVVAHGRRPDREKHYAAVTGHFSDVEFAQESMGVDWLGQKELSQAIPPAYTSWIGEQMKKHILSL